MSPVGLTGSALALVVDLVVDAVNQRRQMDVEDDLGEGALQVVGRNGGCVSALDKGRNQTVAGRIGEVVVDQRVALDVDLGRQLAVAFAADEEVDMGLALARRRPRSWNPSGA